MSTQIRMVDNNLIITRVYDAPIDKVFEAWVQTSKIKQWWGCAECKAVESEVEPKVGGKYNHHMTIDTPGGDHRLESFATLIEFDPPNRLVYTSDDESDPMVISVDFSQLESGTQVQLVHSNIPDMLVEGGMQLHDVVRAGWSAALSKLEVCLQSQS